MLWHSMQKKNIHIVGIGGIGLSSLAQLLLEQGHSVSGCDRSDSIVIENLRKKGITISIGHNASHIEENIDQVIYSDALPIDSEERVVAKEKGIKSVSYFEALGEIANEYNLIAISGTHGKTTTTAMAIDTLEEANFDPVGVVGSLRAKTKSNFRSGQGKWFVVEADEYMKHFLQFNPKILIITNIDSDHLDYYKDLDDIKSAFRELVSRVPENGFIICDESSNNIKDVLIGAKAKIIDYRKFTSPELKVPGEHNRSNAKAVMALASVLSIDEEVARKALMGFAGTWRRFEYKGLTKNGVIVYDDYAHHPKEIEATLQGAREMFPDKKITVIFQPHLYSRTKLLLDDFAEALSKADYIFIADIYAAREKDDGSVSSSDLGNKIKEKNQFVWNVSNFDTIVNEINNSVSSGDVVITMGAGDIYKVGDLILEE